MSDDTTAIGHRVRLIRGWRQLSLRATAELAGVSYGYLGEIERGEKVVTNRAVLEGLATALRVSLHELSGKPWTPQDPAGSDAHAGLFHVEQALEAYELATDPGGPLRGWAEITTDLGHVVEYHHGSYTTDYGRESELATRLLPELIAVYHRVPNQRADALRGLIIVYAAMSNVALVLGGRGTCMLATRLAVQAGEQLDEPEWWAYAVWLRGVVNGSLDRAGQYRRAVAAADQVSGQIHGDGPVLEMTGMLHLSAAMASAAQENPEQAETHLAEADNLAARMTRPVGQFNSMCFGSENTKVHRTDVYLEMGETRRTVEVAREVHPEVFPSPGRKVRLYTNLGRALAADPGTRETGVRTLLHAESLAPQRVRNDLFVHETVADLLTRARQNDTGREIRGLAWRMGVAPLG